MPDYRGDPSLQAFYRDIGAGFAGAPNAAGDNRLFAGTQAAKKADVYSEDQVRTWATETEAIAALIGSFNELAMRPHGADAARPPITPGMAASVQALLTTTIAQFNATVGGNFAAYVRFFAPGAHYIQDRYGVPGIFMIIVGGLENSYGNPTQMKGRVMFNIRAGSGWQGKTQSYGKNGHFRDYDSYFAAVDDFGNLLSRGPYRPALLQYQKDKNLPAYLQRVRLIYAPPSDNNSSNPLPSMLQVLYAAEKIDPTLRPR